MPTDIVLYLGPADMADHVRRTLGAGLDLVHAATDDEVDAVLPEVAAVLDASMAVPFSRDRVERCLRLRVYVTATTGADHVDDAALRERGVPLLTLRGQTDLLRNLTPAAEHSWLLLLACARGLPAALSDAKAARWDRTRHPGMMLRGRTLGIIGCGRIGTWMSRYASAFGMTCLGYDPEAADVAEGIERTDLDSLLSRSDAVSVHVPLLDSTRHLLGARELGLLRRGAIVINTSRGEIIDEAALISAVERGDVGAVGVDVLTGEPDVAAHPMLELARRNPRVLVTPHIGGFSPDALEQVLTFSAGRVVEQLAAIR